MAGEPTKEETSAPAAPSHADYQADTLPGRTGGPAADLASGPPELRDHPRYRIVRLIGQGGMGAVYQAVHKVMDRSVALKVMRTDLTRNASAVERFRREVKAAAQLVHPNIVTAFDAEQVGELHFLVMEYVDGRTLADLVACHGPLSVADAVEYVTQAALGLQYAHEKGMTHRDIKPHNLMIAERQSRNAEGTEEAGASALIKILDFGLARFASDGAGGGQTSSGMMLGTVDYIAPEQADNARTADIRSDIYSLGCTLYHLLAGRVPFPDGSVIQRVMMHVEMPPPPLNKYRTDLPAGLAAVVERMLAKNPAKRFQTPIEVVRALAPYRGLAAAPPALAPATPAATLAGPTAAAEVLDVLPAHPRPRRAAPRPSPVQAAPTPAPRRGRTALGCFLIAVLIILSVTGLGAYGIWLVVERVSNFGQKFLDQAKLQGQVWDQLNKDFSPPPADAGDDRLFPNQLGNFQRRSVDAQAAIPALDLEIKGRHAVYAFVGGELHLYACHPVSKLEKEALFRRALDVVAKGKKPVQAKSRRRPARPRTTASRSISTAPVSWANRSRFALSSGGTATGSSSPPPRLAPIRSRSSRSISSG
jgi:tRNA A-37 threonylcarbamoyl transferase component Bud32